MNIYKEYVDERHTYKLRKAALIIIVHENKFLCLKRALTKETFPGEWGIVGGKCEENDYNEFATAVREVLEEVPSFRGCNVNQIMKPCDFTFDDVENGFSLRFFIMDYNNTGYGPPIPEISDEHCDWFWCPIELGMQVFENTTITELKPFFKYYLENHVK